MYRSDVAGRVSLLSNTASQGLLLCSRHSSLMRLLVFCGILLTNLVSCRLTQRPELFSMQQIYASDT